MAITDPFSLAQAIPDQTLPGGTTWTHNGLIGMYSFQVSASDNAILPAGSTFWATCLSPGGEVDLASHTYDLASFAQANPGINPSAWAYSGTDFWGIQNANYLWKKFALDNNGAPLVNQDQATGLALAMYATLYDSTGYGLLGGNKFTLSTAGLKQEILDAYNSDISYLVSHASDVINNLAAGYVLVPDPETSTSGQEFIVVAPNGMNVVPAPESKATGIGAGIVSGIVALCALRRRTYAN
jgi:hypothetical protein